MKINMGIGLGVPALNSSPGLAVVDGSADVVDRNIVGGDEAAEMEELVEMALCRERDHDDN